MSDLVQKAGRPRRHALSHLCGLAVAGRSLPSTPRRAATTSKARLSRQHPIYGPYHAPTAP
eukprot:611996-Pleurochrysis_carterae.AAC.1